MITAVSPAVPVPGATEDLGRCNCADYGDVLSWLIAPDASYRVDESGVSAQGIFGGAVYQTPRHALRASPSRRGRPRCPVVIHDLGFAVPNGIGA